MESCLFFVLEPEKGKETILSVISMEMAEISKFSALFGIALDGFHPDLIKMEEVASWISSERN